MSIEADDAVVVASDNLIHAINFPMLFAGNDKAQQKIETRLKG